MKPFIIYMLCLSAGCFLCFPLSAQHSPAEINYSVMDLYALRYYPLQTAADSIVKQAAFRPDQLQETKQAANHQKTSVNLVINREFLDGQIHYSTENKDLIYKYLIRPYQSWLQYAVPLKEDARETALTIGLQKDSQNEAIYGFLGKQNVNYLISEILEEAASCQNKIPYRYFLAGEKMLDNQAVYEVAFYPEQLKYKGFTGYLYITSDGYYSLLKAVYTQSNPYNEAHFIRDILFTQTFENHEGETLPVKKDAVFAVGDVIRGSVLVNRTIHYMDSPIPLTAAEQQTENLVRAASQSRAFQNVQNGLHFLLTDRLTIGGEKGRLEWGPVSQSVSYNEIEGLRLKAGGNTTLQVNKQFLLGAYLAYGWRDKQFKYRGDFLYSFRPKDRDIWEFPKRLLSVSYIRDLNIPGKDLLAGSQDYFFHSFTHSGRHNLSLQKLASIRYEHELQNRFSFRIGGKHLQDEPLGRIQYPSYTLSEMNVSLRYAPGEIFLQNREKRIYLRQGSIEFNLSHRLGLKGVLGSDYRYNITNFSAYKRFYLPQNAGTADVTLSAGKVWNPVPFPLLFIPAGNQSYIYEENDYNLMNYYEFTTDRFVAGNIHFLFNWSPFKLFSKSTIQTTTGVKTLYGPLSDTNNPALHPNLFPFAPDVHPLGQTPYVEAHIGLANIFKLFRIEWVQRMTYDRKGAVFVSSGVIF